MQPIMQPISPESLENGSYTSYSISRTQRVSPSVPNEGLENFNQIVFLKTLGT